MQKFFDAKRIKDFDIFSKSQFILFNLKLFSSEFGYIWEGRKSGKKLRKFTSRFRKLYLWVYLFWEKNIVNRYLLDFF